MKQLETETLRMRRRRQNIEEDSLTGDLDDLDEWLSEAEAIQSLRADLLLDPLPQLEVAIRRHRVRGPAVCFDSTRRILKRSFHHTMQKAN